MNERPKEVTIKCYTCWKTLSDPDIMVEMVVPGFGRVAMFWCDEWCYKRAKARWESIYLGLLPKTTLQGPKYAVCILHGIKNGSLVAVKS